MKIAIVGDLKHSHGLQIPYTIYLKKMEVQNWFLFAPKYGSPKVILMEGYLLLKKNYLMRNVIICLRVQKERLKSDEALDIDTYHQNFALTKSL